MTKRSKHKPNTDYAKSPYLAALMSIPPTRGTVQCVEIQHDDWCDLLNGRGHCNCNPIVCAPQIIDMNTKGEA